MQLNIIRFGFPWLVIRIFIFQIQLMFIISVVMFCKVAVTTELVNIKPLFLGETQGFVLESLWLYIFINQSIHNLILCFCLKISHLINMDDLLTLNSQQTAIQTHAWTKYHMYLPHQAPYSLLVLRNTSPHFSTTLGDHLIQ